MFSPIQVFGLYKMFLTVPEHDNQLDFTTLKDSMSQYNDGIMFITATEEDEQYGFIAGSSYIWGHGTLVKGTTPPVSFDNAINGSTGSADASSYATTINKIAESAGLTSDFEISDDFKSTFGEDTNISDTILTLNSTLNAKMDALQEVVDDFDFGEEGLDFSAIIDAKSKFGGAYYSSKNTTLYFFKNTEDKEAWVAAGCPTISLYIADSTLIEFSDKQYQITLTNNNGSNILYFTNDSHEAVLSLLPSTKVKNVTDTEWSNTSEDYTISVQYDKHTKGDWTQIVTNQNLVAGQPYTLDVLSLIDTIASRFKITITGTVSNITTTFIYSATLTSMYLSASNFNWYTPYIEGTEFLVGGLLIGGSINKTLYIKISNAETYSIIYTINIGTNTYTANAYYFDGLEFPSSGSGVYNLDIWLEGGTVTSEHLYYNIICVAKKDEFTAQLVAVSNTADKIINYYDNNLFDYVIYNKGISTGNVTIKLYQISHLIPALVSEETLADVHTSVLNTYRKNIEIESEDADMSLYVLVIYGNEQKINYEIDNSYNFPPTPGAYFYMNPSSRSNTLENREYFVNAVNNQEIPCIFNRLTWADGADGWTIDEDNRKCLMLPSTTSVDVQSSPLSSVGNGKTIEVTFKAKNISDYNKPIIYICDNVNNKSFQGVIIYPTYIVVHSKERNTPSLDSVQSYKFMEEETTNIILSIIKNYKTSYGNLCIIYVNGVKKCEFSFSNYDNWEISSNLHFGSDYADLYVYNLRVYNTAFGYSNAMTNYINSLYNLEDRINCRESNKSIVDDDWEISFDKVSEAANYCVIEVLDNGRLPGYGLAKGYTTWCNWEQHYHDHPEWDFVLSDAQLSGQGTTSMNYKWWNLRVRTDISTDRHQPSVTYPNADTPILTDEGDLYVNLDGGTHPAVERITAKKNFASSMQSHKMGANLAFNDLHHEVVGHNEVEGRVGLYQYPFYIFLKILLDGTDIYTYKFIGLYTIGPDKADKSTYGYNDDDVKNDLLVLEGVDHDKQLAIFKYPWSDNTVTYKSSENAISIIKSNDNYEKGWEVSNSGSAKLEADINTKVNNLWKPAYMVAYGNNPFLLFADSLDEINDPEWRASFTPEGHSYQRYEVWLTSTYDLYYYDVNTLQYQLTGVNVLTDLGLSEDDVTGKSDEEKNTLFIQRRSARFYNNFDTYFDKDDTVFHYVWCYIFGASDNLAKNSYPYILGTYANGYKWRWRQDDLDTIFDIDNQGHSVKNYSIEPDDWTDDAKSAYVYKGEDSVFWTLIKDTCQTEIKTMGKRVLQGMYNLSTSGVSTIDRLYGFFKDYFWKNAQEYFTKSAYNCDAELIYEDSWPLYENGQYSVDVNPLEQSLGDHYEAERSWVYFRLIYCMSKFQYTPFNDYSDTCLGRITIRTQYQQPFTLTPAIDMYPSVLSGQGTILSASNRVKANESITFAGAGGTNTNIYIMAADYIKYLGDLKDLKVDATTSASLTLGVKRLQSIKLGDEDATKVTGNLQLLTIGDSPSIITIDCRNLTSLTGSLDCAKAPSLKYLYLGNTDIRTVIIANGARITTIELPDSILTINFNNLKYLEEGNTETNTGLLYDNLNNLQYLRIENCTSLDAYSILKSCYLAGDTLKQIRVVNFEHDGTLEDFDILSNISKNISSTGNTIEYRGIDANGNIVTTMHPVIEGTINIDGAVYKDSVEAIRAYFYNMVLNINGGYYIRFSDDYFKNILLFHGMGGEGEFANDIHENSLKTITNQNMYDWFSISKSSDTSSTSTDRIYLAQQHGEYFNELEEMTGVTELKVSSTTGVFTGYTALKEIAVPKNLQLINNYTFDGCTSLEKVKMSDTVNTISSYAFRNCTALKEFTYPANLSSIGGYAFYGCNPNMEKLIINMTPAKYMNLTISTGGTSCIPYNNKDNDAFSLYWGNGSLITHFDIPESVSNIKQYLFQCWKGVTFGNIANNNVIQTIGASAFNYCDGLTGDINLPILSSLGNYAFQYAGLSSFKADSLASIPLQCFEYCSNLETVNIKNLSTITTTGIFRYCTKLKNINVLNLSTLTGQYTFQGCTSLEEIELPNIGGGNTFGTGTFKDCTSLRSVTINNADTINYVGLSDSMFYNCTSLTDVILPKGSIFANGSSNNFYNCTSLKNIYLPMRSIVANTPFAKCSSLSNIKIGETINSNYIYTNTFTSINKKGITVDFSESTTGDPVFQYNKNYISEFVYRIIVSDERYDSWRNSGTNIKASCNWRLFPKSEYDKQPVLNYVQFNGGQMYDTNIHGNGYMKFDLFMEYPTTISGQTWFFGQRTGYNSVAATDTADTFGMCFNNGWRLRAGTYSNADTLRFKYYPKTIAAPTTGSTTIGKVTTSSTLTLWPSSSEYGYVYRMRGGFDGITGGCKSALAYTLEGTCEKAFVTHDPDLSTLTMWIGAVNNNGVSADTNLGNSAKIFFLKFYYTYYYIHTLYDTESAATTAAAGLSNAVIHQTDGGKYYFTNYDTTPSNADYRVYTNKYITRELAEAAASGSYIITSNDEEVADFRPYKYTDDEGTHVTFKDIISNHICINHGVKDGAYGEY